MQSSWPSAALSLKQRTRAGFSSPRLAYLKWRKVDLYCNGFAAACMLLSQDWAWNLPEEFIVFVSSIVSLRHVRFTCSHFPHGVKLEILDENPCPWCLLYCYIQGLPYAFHLHCKLIDRTLKQSQLAKNNTKGFIPLTMALAPTGGQKLLGALQAFQYPWLEIERDHKSFSPEADAQVVGAFLCRGFWQQPGCSSNTGWSARYLRLQSWTQDSRCRSPLWAIYRNSWGRAGGSDRYLILLNGQCTGCQPFLNHPVSPYVLLKVRATSKWSRLWPLCTADF